MEKKNLEDVYNFSMSPTNEKVVNAWTEWGPLEEIIVARLPEDTCFHPQGPDWQGSSNNQYIRDTMPYPTGAKHIDTIKRAN